MQAGERNRSRRAPHLLFALSLLADHPWDICRCPGWPRLWALAVLIAWVILHGLFHYFFKMVAPVGVTYISLVTSPFHHSDRWCRCSRPAR